MGKLANSTVQKKLTGYATQLGSMLRALLGAIRPKRNDELGREQGQTLIRVVLTSIVLVHLFANRETIQPASGSSFWVFFILGFVIFSIVVAVIVYRDTTSSVARRMAMNAADVIATSYLMIEVGRAAIPLFIVYLWITIGNGFRFGALAMIVSAALSVTGFSIVIALSPLWQQMPMVSAAVIIAMLVLPLYTFQNLRLRAAALNTMHDNTETPATPAVPRPSFTNSLRQALAKIRVKRHDELGREQGQAMVRVVILAILFTYLTISHYPIDFSDGPPIWLVVVTSYFLLALIGMVLAYRDTDTSMLRRTVTSVADMATISYLLISTGEAGIPFFVLYLWVALGNGFRFGLKSMVISTLLAIAGFSAVVATSDLWRTHLMLAVGVFIGLVLIPGYTAHLIRQLHLARQRAEEASAAKSNFLARMSHELRTPLNGILGTTELLAVSKRFSREDRSLLDVIRDSVRVSMRQIDNVLDFSKIEAGKLQIEQVEFDLHELLNRSARLVRGIAVEKHLRLSIQIDPTLPYRLIGDPHHVHEVLLNLLSNALKFTPAGYVSLEAHLVRTLDDVCLVRLEVHDTGIGIESDALGRIFEAFSQENTGTTRRYGGTGLGTTIAKQLVELMGGKLSVTSTKNQGSTFQAVIPFSLAPTILEDVPQLGGLRALLVSKNDALHDRIALLLREWGASLQVVSTSAEAEGLLRRGIRVGNRIHTVLVDSTAVLTSSGSHAADDLLQKATLSFTPVYLVSDVAPEETQLRRWGYAGVLSYDLPRTVLFNALHACGSAESEGERGVVRVEPWAWKQSSRQRARLLVADDNRTNLMILRKILETADYDVDTAEDGEQALDLILRGRYKAAVIDMHMPGLDGIAVIKQYRMMARGARTPIIMLTANATVDAKLESAEAGADAYLTKPATATTIISTIEKLLDDTEIHELNRNRAKEPVAQEVPVLDTSLMAELDRLYNNPTGVSQILDEFESESRRLLDGIGKAVAGKNHSSFCDLLHALKGNGANVGAMRLAQTCQEAEGFGLLDFRRDGEQLLRRLDASLTEAILALREFTATGDPGPAQGSDLP